MLFSKDEKSLNDLINKATMSDDKVLAFYETPRFLFTSFLDSIPILSSLFLSISLFACLSSVCIFLSVCLSIFVFIFSFPLPEGEEDGAI